MNADRPKLLVVGESAEVSQALSRLLADAFDVESQTSVDAASEAAGEGADGTSPAGYSATIRARDEHPGSEYSGVLLDAIGEGVCLAEPDGNVVWANRFFRELDQASQNQIGACCADGAAFFKASLGRLGGGGELNCKFELCVSVPGDEGETDRHLEVFVTPGGEVAPGEAPSRLAVVVRDVTRAREHARKMAAVDRAGYELTSLDATDLEGKNAMQRLGMLEDRIVEIAHDLLSFDHFAIFMLEEDSGRLELVVSHGLPEEIQDFKLFKNSEGSGISGWVAETGQSYLCHNADSDERYLPGLVGARSSLTVPLLLHDQVIGIMDIESRTEHAFDEEDRQFAEIFSRHIAVAFHMLGLLVAERCRTNEAVSDRIEHELDEPLEDIVQVIESLQAQAGGDPTTAAQLARISEDVGSIKNRLKNVAGGPQTLLGVDRVMSERGEDPLLAHRRILVVDDESRVRKIIGDMLSCRGAEVTLAGCGDEAFEHLKRGHAVDGSPYELVISDIKLPDANGYEVYRAAQKSKAGIPVILMTGFGYDPHHSIVRASQEGLRRVLFKPFEVQQLLDEVRQVFDESSDE